MKTGNYWGGATHRKIIEEEKREVLQAIKELTEQYLIEPHEITKTIIEDQQAYYRRLLDFKF